MRADASVLVARSVAEASHPACGARTYEGSSNGALVAEATAGGTDDVACVVAAMRIRLSANVRKLCPLKDRRSIDLARVSPSIVERVFCQTA